MDTTIDYTTMMFSLILLLPIIGFMMAITPYLMKKSECFAVTVPEAAINDPYLKGLKRRYALIVALATVILSALGFVFAFTGFATGVLILIIAGLLFLCGFGYALMLYCRQKVRLYKKAQNWAAAQQEAVALIGNEHIPQAISLKWNLLYIPVILVTLAVGYAGYDQMPDVITMHVGLSGQADGWMDKSPLVVWMPAFIQIFMALVFVFSHWMITRSKRNASPNSPASSAMAYGMFAHAQSIFLLATGLLICAAMIAMPFSFIGILTLMQAGIAILIAAIIIAIGALGISIVYGQGGSRLFARMQESDTLLADDDRYWKLGIFYYNKEDPSWFLLERFGIGWTVNWARPAVWLIIAAGLAITIAFIVVVMVIS